jgi:hypothetical protein
MNTPSSSKDAVKDVLDSLDDHTLSDTKVLIKLMQEITGHEPQIWNKTTLGFDSYHYKYESGREGDCHVLGFNPRKGKITFYLMDGTARHEKLLKQLGKHTTSKACLYIKHLKDIELSVLEKILRNSYEYVKSMDGQMHRAE